MSSIGTGSAGPGGYATSEGSFPDDVSDTADLANNRDDLGPSDTVIIACHKLPVRLRKSRAG